MKKVLIIEDNEDISKFLRIVLEDMNTVIIADNGEAWLAQFSSFKPDLIITDGLVH